MSGRRAIAVVLLAGAAMTAALFAVLDVERGALARPPCRLAVTAFAVTPGGAGSPDAALGEGLAAALAAQLGGIRGVDAVGPAELAREERGDRGPFTLRLAGRLLATAPRVEIEMAWLDGASGRVRRRARLTGERGRIFELQERLARDTAELCGIRPSFAERRALARGLASSPPAYELYLRARAELDGAGGSGSSGGSRPSAERSEAAAGLLRRAIAEDSGFALAHAALAEALVDQGMGREAVAEAEQARELDDHLPAIHLALVRADRAAGRPAAARTELLRLLSLRPEIAAARRDLR